MLMTIATRNMRIAVTDAHSTVLTAFANDHEAMRGCGVLAKAGTGTALLDAPRRFGFNADPIRYAAERGFA
ncbi:hypothetical protein LMG27952_00533 [Paraburkholderia hiiakae]|uniref:Uncharacterized protein n=2 Tax=Paraburkholderia hiiakae TaxID=1081782 RepID=A0ABM8NAL5_9BURK|nr:hypothetical protein LMG27952_00533 [Paraburkholderia hiiakae]